MNDKFGINPVSQSPMEAFLANQEWVNWPRKPLGKGGPGKSSHGMAKGGKGGKSKGGRGKARKGY